MYNSSTFNISNLENTVVHVPERNHHIICRPCLQILKSYLQTQKLLVPSSFDYSWGSKQFPGLYIHCFPLLYITTCDSSPFSRKKWQIFARQIRKHRRCYFSWQRLLQPMCTSLTGEIMAHLSKKNWYVGTERSTWTSAPCCVLHPVLMI